MGRDIKRGGRGAIIYLCPLIVLKLVLTVAHDREYDTEIAPINELRLRHLTVDEALPRLDQFLHDTFIADLIQVKIIHGKGTGILRQMVRRVLGKHSLVKSFRPGDYREGGEGVTIVELAEK